MAMVEVSPAAPPPPPPPPPPPFQRRPGVLKMQPKRKKRKTDTSKIRGVVGRVLTGRRRRIHRRRLTEAQLDRERMEEGMALPPQQEEKDPRPADFGSAPNLPLTPIFDVMEQETDPQEEGGPMADINFQEELRGLRGEERQNAAANLVADWIEERRVLTDPERDTLSGIWLNLKESKRRRKKR